MTLKSYIRTILYNVVVKLVMDSDSDIFFLPKIQYNGNNTRLYCIFAVFTADSINLYRFDYYLSMYVISDLYLNSYYSVITLTTTLN